MLKKGFAIYTIETQGEEISIIFVGTGTAKMREKCV